MRVECGARQFCRDDSETEFLDVRLFLLELLKFRLPVFALACVFVRKRGGFVRERNLLNMCRVEHIEVIGMRPDPTSVLRSHGVFDGRIGVAHAPLPKPLHEKTIEDLILDERPLRPN